MKKILLISHELSVTGAPLSLKGIANILEEVYDLTIWSLKDGPLKQVFEHDLNITPIIIDKTTNTNIDQLYSRISKFDFVIVNTIVCYEYANICEKLKIPYIWIIRESKEILDYMKKYPFLLKTMKNCTKNILVVSEYVQDYLKKEFGLNVNVIHNFVEDEYKSNSLTNIEYPLNFTFIGTIQKRKGLDVLVSVILDSFDKSNQINFNIIGASTPANTSFSDNLKNLTNLCTNVIWRGTVTGEKRQKIFEETDVFVVPSRDEASSRVVLEACMMGRPVIVTENVGAKYMVKENTGWIVKTGDVVSLKNCIETILDNPKRLPEMGLAAREMYLKTSTPEIYKEKLGKIINGKIQNHKFNKLRLLLNKLYSVNYLQNHKITYFLGIKIKQKYNQELSPLEKIFSVKNKDIHKMITICGLKIKIKKNS